MKIQYWLSMHLVCSVYYKIRKNGCQLTPLVSVAVCNCLVVFWLALAFSKYTAQNWVTLVLVVTGIKMPVSSLVHKLNSSVWK